MAKKIIKKKLKAKKAYKFSFKGFLKAFNLKI